MDILILFAQRKETYPGEYAPEALAVMTEFDDSDNPDYLCEEKQKADDSKDFENTAIIRLNVDQKEIMRILRPGSEAIPATVVAD